VVNPARERAISYLARFARTSKQVADYLTRKEFTPDQIQDALSYLTEHRYLNDDSFAESFIREKIYHKDGPYKIKQMLFQKGIALEISNRLIMELYPVEVQQENAALLMKQKLVNTGSASKLGQLQREKLFRFVASRGFNRYVIIQAFKSL
jgi:regulatory protein